MKLVFIMAVSLFIFGCGKKDDVADAADYTETAQQIGDVMASVDEMGTANGSLALNEKFYEKTFARLAPDNSGELTKKNLVQLIQPAAVAGTCSGAGFAACSGTTVTRTFSDCSVGTGTFNGTVALTWGVSNSGCSLTGTSGTITREPNFTVTGRRNAILTVSKNGTYGQKLTWVSGSGTSKVFSLTSDGINRKFISGAGKILFNHTTQITSAISVTGTDRASRVMNNGILSVTDSLSSTTCNFAPINVTWGPSCNCPVSGTWNGTCSSGSTSKLVITGCGIGTYTDGTNTGTVNLDRCGT